MPDTRHSCDLCAVLLSAAWASVLKTPLVAQNDATSPAFTRDQVLNYPFPDNLSSRRRRVQRVVFDRREQQFSSAEKCRCGQKIASGFWTCGTFDRHVLCAYPPGVTSALGRQQDEPIRIAERQRAQQHGVDDREDRRVGADAEREDDDGHDQKCLSFLYAAGRAIVRS